MASPLGLRVVCDALRNGAFFHNGVPLLYVNVALVLFSVVVGGPFSAHGHSSLFCVIPPSDFYLVVSGSFLSGGVRITGGSLDFALAARPSPGHIVWM